MRDQPRGGHVFNMDGAGADGNPTPRFAAYGATKRSLAQVRVVCRLLLVASLALTRRSPGLPPPPRPDGCTPALPDAARPSTPQLGKSLEAELKLAKISNVGIHNLSPGMVTTELLMSGANTPQARWFINALGACACVCVACARRGASAPALTGCVAAAA